MKRMAMIRYGIVQNIAVWDGINPWNPVGYVVVDITTVNTNVNIGWLYDNTGTFSAPPPED